MTAEEIRMIQASMDAINEIRENISETKKLNGSLENVRKESKLMTKEDIYSAMYEVIDDSMEWGFECDKNEYIHFVDGIRSMTEKLISKMDNKSFGLVGENKVC